MISHLWQQCRHQKSKSRIFAAAGYKGKTGDCVTRSIAIATGKPYQEVYDALNGLAMMERIGRRRRKSSNSRSDVYRRTYQRYLESLGWRWTSTMTIGSGCQVYLRASELSHGPLVVKVSRHRGDQLLNDAKNSASQPIFGSDHERSVPPCSASSSHCEITKDQSRVRGFC